MIYLFRFLQSISAVDDNASGRKNTVLVNRSVPSLKIAYLSNVGGNIYSHITAASKMSAPTAAQTSCFVGGAFLPKAGRYIISNVSLWSRFISFISASSCFSFCFFSFSRSLSPFILLHHLQKRRSRKLCRLRRIYLFLEKN